MNIGLKKQNFSRQVRTRFDRTCKEHGRIWLILALKSEICTSTLTMNLGINEFRNSLCSEENGSKIKFAVKILRCLQYTNLHPESLPIIGATWYLDGTTFTSNSQILGDFLKIKPNTINTNFRWHGFKKVEAAISDITRKFPNIPDARNWKVRRSSNYTFNSSSTDDDAKKIPCYAPTRQDPAAQVPQFAVNLVPREIPPKIMHPTTLPVLHFIQTDPYIMHSLQVILHSIKKPQEEKNKLISKSSEEWKKMFGESIWGSTETVAAEVCSQYEGTQIYDQLFSNVQFLLGSSDACSQSLSQDERFSYVHFLKFFLQYGSPMRAGKIINELTAMQSFLDFNSQTGPRPTFQPWFQPTFNDKTANALLSSQPDGTWLVRPSSTPGNFIIHKKIAKGFTSTIFATRIVFNCLEDDNRLFFVEFEGKGKVFADSWDSLLFTTLKLKYENSPNFNNIFKKTSYKKADEIMASQIKESQEATINFPSQGMTIDSLTDHISADPISDPILSQTEWMDL